MEILAEHALRLLRDRDYSHLEDEVRAEIISLFADDKEKPSRAGRMTLALNVRVLGMVYQEHRLEAMAIDILMGCDKLDVLDALNRLQTFLLETYPE